MYLHVVGFKRTENHVVLCVVFLSVCLIVTDEENQTEGSSVPLRTLSNCCYFMAKVLEGNKE